MAIQLLQFQVLGSRNGEYRLGRCEIMHQWPNDYFYERFDIFDETQWQNLITHINMDGRTLPKLNEQGDFLIYCIFVRGTDRFMRSHFGQAMGYLFPQRNHMDKGSAEPMLSFNRKYIWPYLRG
jgi:hypothetical protein